MKRHQTHELGHPNERRLAVALLGSPNGAPTATADTPATRRPLHAQRRPRARARRARLRRAAEPRRRRALDPARRRRRRAAARRRLAGRATIIRDLRRPADRCSGSSVGAALGVAGALMQALTRNPLADPGLLGVNAGASAAVVIAHRLLGHHARRPATSGSPSLGAAVASVAGLRLGSRRPRRRDAGAARARRRRDQRRADRAHLRRRAARPAAAASSTASGRSARSAAAAATQLEPVAAVHRASGSCSRSLLARPLNALALGDDAARALGAQRRPDPGRAAPSPITLLCGAATAAAGPIAFVGLTVPHVARGDHRPRPALGAAVLGGARRRCCCSAPTSSAACVVRPGELQVGHRHRVPRRAGLHRARAPPADRAAVSAVRRSAGRAGRRSRRLAARAPRRSSSAWSLVVVVLAARGGRARHRRLPDPARRRARHAARRRRPRRRRSSSRRCGCRGCCARLLVGAALGHRPARSSSRSRATRSAAPDIIGFTAGRGGRRAAA